MAYTYNVAQFTVVIDVPDKTGSLIGAVSGFTTDEDDGNDIFVASRLQTATLRIIDTGTGTWRNLIPVNDTQFSVAIYSDYGFSGRERVRWRGFMKAQAYTGDLCDYPMTVELAAQCPLSALQSFDIDPYLYDEATFGQLIEHCLTNNTMDSSLFAYLYFPDDNIADRLSCTFSWALLYEMTDDYKRKAKYNCLEALEEFCRFFGLTMVYYHTGAMCGIQFAAADKNPTYKYFTLDDLKAYNSKGTAIKITSKTLSNYELGSSVYFHNTGNTLEILNGTRKVTVTADLYNNGLNWNAENEMKRKFYQPTTSKGGWKGERFIFLRGLLTSSTSISALTIECKDATVSFPETTLAASPTSTDWNLDAFTLSSGARPMYVDLYKGSTDDKKKIDLTFSWQCKSKDNNLATNTDGAFMRSRMPLLVKSGYINISASVFIFTQINDYVTWKSSEKALIYAWLRIGKYYWNDNDKKWTTTRKNFKLPLTNSEEDSMGEIDNSIGLVDGFLGYNGGMLIPVDGTSFGIASNYNGVEGIVEFGIVGFYDSDSKTTITGNVENLTVTYLPQYTGDQQETLNEMEYVATNDGGYMDERNVSLIFASNTGNVHGSSIIYKDNIPVSSISQLGTSGNPERVLADRIAAYYSKGREILKIYSNISDSLNFPMAKITYNGKYYNCISVARDYENNEATITVMEIDN